MPKSKLQSLASHWEGFAEACVPGLSPGHPIYEAHKRAFYGGALCLFLSIKRIGEPDITEEEGAVFLDSVEKELLAFKREVDEQIRRLESERN